MANTAAGTISKDEAAPLLIFTTDLSRNLPYNGASPLHHKNSFDPQMAPITPIYGRESVLHNSPLPFDVVFFTYHIICEICVIGG